MHKAVFLALIPVAALAQPKLPTFAQARAQEEKRDAWQKTPEILEAMRVKPGARVAEVGPGLGYFIPRLAKAAGAQGRVFAVDDYPPIVAYLKQRAADEKWENVVVVQGKKDDPGLAPESLDAVLIAITYHTMAEPRPMLRQILRALTRGGRLVIVDPHRDKPEWATLPAVEAALREDGYEIVASRAKFVEKPEALWLVAARKP